MKTVVALVAVLAVLAVLAAGLLYYSPAFRTHAITAAESLTQWTPDAIQKDPIGYSQFVEAQLKKDLKTFQENRKLLSRQMETLAKMHREKMADLELGEKFATEFAAAITEGVFPVFLLGKSYTESQLKNQLAMILDRVTSLKKSLADIGKFTQIVEKEIRKNVVRIEDVESQLAMMSTQREIFRSQSTSDTGLALLAEARSVLERNKIQLQENPVRTIVELIKDSTSVTTAGSASNVEVERFLADYLAKKRSKEGKKLVQNENLPVVPETNTDLIQLRDAAPPTDTAKEEGTDAIGPSPSPSVNPVVETSTTETEPEMQPQPEPEPQAEPQPELQPQTKPAEVTHPLQTDVEPAENTSDTESETESCSSTETKINEFTPISELQKLADKGDPAACYELGKHYRKGTGSCKKDEDKGNQYYIKGSESDTPVGWYCKAVCYELGIGTDKDARKAFEWYKKAAERGEVRSQREVGFCYQGGIGTDKDLDKAFEWVQKAAEQGDVFAQNNMGWCYQEGWGTSKDARKAFYWFQKAAEQGEMNAQCTLANCYWKGIGTLVDLKKAYYWYLKAAEQGFSNAQYWLGMRHFFGEDGVPKNEDTAVQWLTKAADQGHTKAQSTLGAIYFKRFEFEEAKKYLEPAAEKKDAQAQYYLASGYLAAKYYRRANEGPMSNDESEEYAFILLVASMKQGNEDARKMLELHKHNGNLSRPLRGDMPIFSDNRELVDLLK